jgi:hypothetical protein
VSGRFRASGSIPLSDVGLFAVHGELVDGVARIGQIAHIGDGFHARVHGVELVRLADGHEDLALTFLPPSAEEASRWNALALAGQEIELRERASEGQAPH